SPALATSPRSRSRSSLSTRVAGESTYTLHASPTPYPVPVSPITPPDRPAATTDNSFPCSGRHENSNSILLARSTALATISGSPERPWYARVPPTDTAIASEVRNLNSCCPKNARNSTQRAPANASGVTTGGPHRGRYLSQPRP